MLKENNPYQMFASGLFFGSLLTLGILMTIPQEDADFMTYLGLAAGFSLMIVSFFSFLGIVIRRMIFKKTPPQNFVKPSIRQSIELMLVLGGLLALQLLEVLNLWGAILIIAAVVFAEITISAKKYSFTSKLS